MLSQLFSVAVHPSDQPQKEVHLPSILTSQIFTADYHHMEVIWSASPSNQTSGKRLMTDDGCPISGADI
jgi:hypothetical protein